VEVQWVGDVTVKINKGNNGTGSVTVQVVEVGSGPIAGVTVSGSWEVNGNAGYATSTGVTGSDGMVTLSTGGIRFATDFGFCVTGLAGLVVDRTTYTQTSPCDVYGLPAGGGGGGGGGGGDPAAAPTNLVGTAVQKGKNARAELAWSGGGSTVEVLRNGGIIATVSNSGSYADNLGKTPDPSYTYEVCNAGTSDCTGEIAVSF